MWQFRQTSIAEHGQQAQVPGVELAADLLRFANPDIQRAVEHVEDQVAAAVMGDNCRRYVRRDSQAFQCLAFQRSR